MLTSCTAHAHAHAHARHAWALSDPIINRHACVNYHVNQTFNKKMPCNGTHTFVQHMPYNGTPHMPYTRHMSRFRSHAFKGAHW